MLDDAQRATLQELVRSRRTSVRLAERAAIVLHAAAGLQDKQIAATMGIPRQKAPAGVNATPKRRLGFSQFGPGSR